MNKAIHWFRQDLRLADNPALSYAAKHSQNNVVPIFILEEDTPEELTLGAASDLWLHHSLKSLDNSLNKKLNFFKGDPLDIISKLLAKHKDITSVFWNRLYDPHSIARDKKIKAKLKEQNIECKTFNGSLLWEPFEISKKDGTYYKVFTPFYNRGCLAGPKPRDPINTPSNVTYFKLEQKSLSELELLPKHPWGKKIEKSWQFGEQAAKEKAKKFVQENIKGYKQNRNHPADTKATSRLSPHLHFGEISPNQVWDMIQKKSDSISKTELIKEDISHFMSELAWREFSHYLLYHFPKLCTDNFQKQFDHFPWRKDKALLEKWKKGQTGCPIVDAGMRELWETGYMHNRVRMIAASFLVKNLMIDWRLGRDWFNDCLVDADLANNNSSWQWVAGSGADAAPYFRIFNPILQGEKFDPQGSYTKEFVPELKNLEPKYLFKPWEAPKTVLEDAKIELGKDYPKLVVNLQLSRDAALDAYQKMRSKATTNS